MPKRQAATTNQAAGPWRTRSPPRTVAPAPSRQTRSKAAQSLGNNEATTMKQVETRCHGRQLEPASQKQTEVLLPQPPPQPPPPPPPPRPKPKPKTKKGAQPVVRQPSPDLQAKIIEEPSIETQWNALTNANIPEDNPFIDRPDNEDEPQYALTRGGDPYPNERSVGPEFFTFDDNDFEEVEPDTAQGQVLVTSTPLRSGPPLLLRVPTPSRTRVPRTITLVDTPTRRGGRRQVLADDDDFESEVEDREELSSSEERDTDRVEDLGAHSDPETYVSPARNKGKARAKALAKPRNHTKAKAGPCQKRVTFEDDLEVAVAEVSTDSDDEDDIRPASIRRTTGKAGSRVFREDKPHILKVYASDIVPFFEPTADNKEAICKFCKKKAESVATHVIKKYGIGSSTSTIRGHLMAKHPFEWITACDSSSPPIQIQGVQAVQAAAFRTSNNLQIVRQAEQPQFTLHLLGEHIVRLIVEEDLSLIFVEATTLRNLLLMLRDGLRDDQIPRRTTLSKMVYNYFVLEMHGLIDDFKAPELNGKHIFHDRRMD
ncbi:hypothetical protein AAF712_014687 [Marasmius tenuissimus]|uniref:BED-type domain-containing protein n=1 Tax=Marasmius tenuissimus TaxID=585030 RepID=A0ABR2ZAL2_9AGAR